MSIHELTSVVTYFMISHHPTLVAYVLYERQTSYITDIRRPHQTLVAYVHYENTKNRHLK